MYGQCRAGAQIIFPESGRGQGHVTPTILAVRSAILATAWLLVIYKSYTAASCSAVVYNDSHQSETRQVVALRPSRARFINFFPSPRCTPHFASSSSNQFREHSAVCGRRSIRPLAAHDRTITSFAASPPVVNVRPITTANPGGRRLTCTVLSTDYRPVFIQCLSNRHRPLRLSSFYSLPLRQQLLAYSLTHAHEA